MLRSKLKPAIPPPLQKKKEIVEGFLLLYDNARSHYAAHTKETLQELKFEALNHPSYSPETTHSDFHLFGPLKGAVKGRRFADDDEVKEAGHDWHFFCFFMGKKTCGPLDY
jgi:hypothetical protein